MCVMLFMRSVCAWFVFLASFGVDRAALVAPIYCRMCVARMSKFGAHAHGGKDCFVGDADTHSSCSSLELVKLAIDAFSTVQDWLGLC